MRRRSFLRFAASAGAGAFAIPQPVVAADAEIELSPAQPGPSIPPDIYGHFIEHLGGVIYDGIWVGDGSKVANIGGIRRAFVDDMKRISAPNLRWPGGCFADGYHWRDGLGQLSARPRTYNYWEAQMPPGTSATETNHFGTHEFMRLCRLIGAAPYVAANVGSGSPREFYDWMNYCNAPAGSLTLANERAANGDTDPFNVKYWGVGNESWGCGGRMTPAEYAAKYRLFSAQVPAYVPPFLVAVGPRGHSTDLDLGWTTGFFEALREVRGAPPNGFAMHFYTDFRPTPVKAESSTAREWHAVLHEGERIDEIIQRHWSAMAKYDPQHRTKLVIDEWGTWYTAQSRRLAPRYILSQTMTLRDAVHAAITFDIFNRHAEKIAMANIAQTINCLHSLFLAEGDRYVRTPVYYVFEMYRPHMNGRLVPVKISSEEISAPLLEGTGRLAAIGGSASIRDRMVTLTLTNRSADASTNVRVRLASGPVLEARGSVLTHSDPAAANTFTEPDLVRPAPLPVSLSGDAVTASLPRRSVAALAFRIS